MKRIYLFLVFQLLLITNSTFLLCQKQGQVRIDSLLLELPKAKEDTNKVNILTDLSFKYNLNNPDKGIEYGKIALALAEKLNWKLGIADAYNCLGVNYKMKSDFSKALEYYFKALKINEELGLKIGMSAQYNNIGTAYKNQANYTQAIDYYFKALSINEELGNRKGIASNLNNLGTLYERQKNYTKALDCFFRAQMINEELKENNGLASNFTNIGIVYERQENYTKALEYHFKSLKKHEELKNKAGLAIVYSNIGLVYHAQLNYPKALEYYFKAFKINQELGIKEGSVINLANIGATYILLSVDSNLAKINERTNLLSLTKESNINRGIFYLEQAVPICKEINNPNTLFLIYNNLSEGYSQLGNFKKAFEYHVLFQETKDSVFNLDNNLKIATLESKRENDLKEKQIQIQKLEIEKQKANQNSMWLGLGSLIVIVFSLGFLLMKLSKQKKLSDRLLANILPAPIAARLKKKEKYIADHFDEASVVFIDIVDFTKQSRGSTPERMVQVLNKIYTEFDKIAAKHGLEKIKTIGDCYMAAAGIPEPNSNHAGSAAHFAIEAMQKMNGYVTSDGTEINFRVGIDCGPAIAGVIGENKFIYDLWGDMVNTASRLETSGVSGKIQCTNRFKIKVESRQPILRNHIGFEERGEIEVKGKGLMKTWFLINK